MSRIADTLIELTELAHPNDWQAADDMMERIMDGPMTGERLTAAEREAVRGHEHAGLLGLEPRERMSA